MKKCKNCNYCFNVSSYSNKGYICIKKHITNIDKENTCNQWKKQDYSLIEGKPYLECMIFIPLAIGIIIDIIKELIL